MSLFWSSMGPYSQWHWAPLAWYAFSLPSYAILASHIWPFVHPISVPTPLALERVPQVCYGFLGQAWVLSRLVRRPLQAY